MYNIAGFTLAGVDHYLQLAKENGDVDKSLFDGIKLFEGGEFYDQEIDPIDPDIIENEIIERYGELLTYRQQPGAFKKLSDNFFKKNYKNFAKIQIAIQMDFNPIYNYDRYEKWTDNRESKAGTIYEDTRTITPSGSERLTTEQLGHEKTETTPTGSEKNQVTNDATGVTTTKVSAYNSSDWENQEQVTQSVPGTTNTTSFTNRKDTTDLSFQDRITETTTTFINRNTVDKVRHDYLSGADLDDNIHNGHLYGNIGVTTSTAMIKEIIELYDFDIYKYIADKYARELLLMIY